MSDTSTRRTGGEQRKLRLDRPADWMEPLPESSAWGALNTMISGIALFTVLGWLLGLWLDALWITAIGMVAGMAAGVTGIWFRYGLGRVTLRNEPDRGKDVEPVERTSDTKENR